MNEIFSLRQILDTLGYTVFSGYTLEPGYCTLGLYASPLIPPNF